MGFPEGKEKILAVADHFDPAAVRGSDCADERYGDRAVHLYAVLNDRQAGGVMARNILGISAYYHDAAAALLCDGEIIAAAHEERFTRIKHDPAFPPSQSVMSWRKAVLRLPI